MNNKKRWENKKERQESIPLRNRTRLKIKTIQLRQDEVDDSEADCYKKEDSWVNNHKEWGKHKEEKRKRNNEQQEEDLNLNQQSEKKEGEY